jgi:hypothetical protein
LKKSTQYYLFSLLKIWGNKRKSCLFM